MAVILRVGALPGVETIRYIRAGAPAPGGFCWGAQYYFVYDIENLSAPGRWTYRLRFIIEGTTVEIQSDGTILPVETTRFVNLNLIDADQSFYTRNLISGPTERLIDMRVKGPSIRGNISAELTEAPNTYNETDVTTSYLGPLYDITEPQGDERFIAPVGAYGVDRMQFILENNFDPADPTSTLVGEDLQGPIGQSSFAAFQQGSGVTVPINDPVLGINLDNPMLTTQSFVDTFFFNVQSINVTSELDALEAWALANETTYAGNIYRGFEA